MRLMTGSVAAAAICLSAFAISGCAKPKPAETPAAPATVEFKVVSLELGSAIGPDKKVLEPKTVFGKNDTIYLSVATEGASPSATLSAKWTFGDGAQLVNEGNESIAPTGPTNTEFHIAKPSGWPAGKYQVEVTLNGSPAGRKDFEVR